MRKHAQNRWIDAGLFVTLLGLFSTGVILYFVLPPGSRQETLVTLTRHQWGDIHFWISVVFILLIVWHLSLHGKWILASYFKGKD